MKEVLVVAAKVKRQIKEKGAMNTSAASIEALSRLVELVLEKSIASAKADGRRTVLDRDIPNHV